MKAHLLEDRVERRLETSRVAAGRSQARVSGGHTTRGENLRETLFERCRRGGIQVTLAHIGGSKGLVESLLDVEGGSDGVRSCDQSRRRDLELGDVASDGDVDRSRSRSEESRDGAVGGDRCTVHGCGAVGDGGGGGGSGNVFGQDGRHRRLGVSD